jgi:hypothetical protein
MLDRIEIRPARNGDRDFVAGLASSLLESPAWEDLDALAPGFRKVLAALCAIKISDPPP